MEVASAPPRMQPMYADNKAPTGFPEGGLPPDRPRARRVRLSGCGSDGPTPRDLPVVRGSQPKGRFRFSRFKATSTDARRLGLGQHRGAGRGTDGALLVDTGAALDDRGGTWPPLNASRTGRSSTSSNTTHAQDHTGGNKAVSEARSDHPVSRAKGTAAFRALSAANKASIISYLSVSFTRIGGAARGHAIQGEEGAWPNNTYSIELKRLHFNDEPRDDHASAGKHGREQAWSCSAGPIVVAVWRPAGSHGFSDDRCRRRGGSIRAIVAALNPLDRHNRSQRAFGGRHPGGSRATGRIADYAEVAQYRDMMTVIPRPASRI